MIGSKAYNLGRKTSDFDYIGFFAVNPDSFWGLHIPAENLTTQTPCDVSLHELRKFCGLLIKGNMRFVEVLDPYNSKHD